MKYVVEIAAVFAWAVVMVAAIGSAAYLAMRGHPWIAVLVLIIAGGISVKTGKAAESDAAKSRPTQPQQGEGERG